MALYGVRIYEMTITRSRIALLAVVLLCSAVPAIAAESIPVNVTEEMLFADDPKEWLSVRRVSQPEYPKDLFKAGTTGHVDLGVTIDEVGAVRKIGTVVSNPVNPLFEKSARESVLYWSFKPAISKDCVPQIAEGNVRIWFDIRDGKEAISVSPLKPGQQWKC
ncbi:MAG: TonB family protein [Betaproteobacteria bacterium]|nr:TonB family protein [Betaproteobacteria bacterium]